MDERYSDSMKYKLTRAFEEKYSGFLTELADMPKGTKEDKERRWKFYLSYPMQAEFVTDLLKAFHPGAFGIFKRRLSDSGIACSPDWGLAGFIEKSDKGKDKDIDGLVFSLAVKETICAYTGVNQHGKHYTFLAAVGQSYKHRMGKDAAINRMEKNGIFDFGLSRKRKLQLMKTVKSLKAIKNEKTLKSDMDIKGLEDELMSEAKGNKWKPKKEEKELVLRLVDNESLLVSIKTPMNEDGYTIGETLEDKKNPYQEVEESNLGIDFVQVFCQHVEECWEGVKSALELRERESIKMFFTRDVLKVLKLDDVGEPYQEEPAGDEEFYYSLEPQGEFLYEKVFYREYLKRAFIENPKRFYEVYARLLRPDFDFTDKILAEIEKKDKATISKRRKNYVKWMEDFYRYYMIEFS